MTTTAVTAAPLEWTDGHADALRLSLDAYAERVGVARRTVAYRRSRPSRRLTNDSATLLDVLWDRADTPTRERFAALVGKTHPNDHSPATDSLDVRAQLAELTSRVDQLTALTSQLATALGR